MKSKRIEILITADIKELGEDDEERLRLNIRRSLKKQMQAFIGDSDSAYIDNVNHKVIFENEGNFKFEKSPGCVCDRCSKRDNPECVGNVKTFLRGVVVDCSGFKEKPEY